MKKRISKIVMLSMIALGLNAQEELINRVKGSGDKKDGFIFKDEKVIKHTSVKNQGMSGTCWSYASISFIESETMRISGADLDLSEIFVARKSYYDKAYRYVMVQGRGHFSQGGAVNDPVDVIKRYGMIPQSAYTGLTGKQELNNHYELETSMKGFLNGVVESKRRHKSNVWKKAVDGILDAYLGNVPNTFKYKGKTYTPRSFADNVVKVNPKDYVYFTSLSNQPFYQKTDVPVQDNWSWFSEYNNLPIDEFMKVIDNAINKGYSISFGADISEKGFSLKNGIAIVPEKDYTKMTKEEKKDMFNGPKKEKIITDKIRLEAFENYETTDDHGMHIIGISKDQKGNKYYKVKNSWGTKRGNRKGYIYFSEAFMRYKALSILIHKDAVPKDISKKIK